MQHALDQIWETYVAAWEAASADGKRAALSRSVASDSVYRDPLVEVTGHDELVRYMLDLHRQLPGARFVTTYFRAHHGRSIAKWNMVDGGGKVVGDGVSYGEYGRDGKLVAMTGFFDPPERPA